MSLDLDKSLLHVGTAHSSLIAELGVLRKEERSHPLIRFFITDHVSQVVRRLRDEYAELAPKVPQTHEYHAWLVTTQGDLREFALHLPSQAPMAIIRYLQKPLLWLVGTGGATVLGFKLSRFCLCHLATGLTMFVPMFLVGFIVPASRRARARIQRKSAGIEQRLAELLDIPLQREVPWDIVCMAAATGWYFAAPYIFRRTVTFTDWFTDLLFIGGVVTAVATLYMVYQWIAEKGFRPVYL